MSNIKKKSFNFSTFFKYSPLFFAFCYISTLSVFDFSDSLSMVSKIVLVIFCLYTFLSKVILYRKKFFSYFLHNSCLLFLAPFVLVSLLSVAWSSDRSEAFSSWVRVAELSVLLFFMSMVVEDDVSIDVICLAFIVSSLLLMVITFFVYPLSSIQSAFMGGSVRLGGGFTQANAYGNYLEYSAMASLFLAITKKSYFFLFFVLLDCVFCVGTQSRAALFTLFLLILFAFIYFLAFSEIGSKKKTLFLLLSFVLLAVFIGLALTLPAFERLRNALFSGESGGSVGERQSLVSFAWSLVVQRPALGYGLDQFRFLYCYEYGALVPLHNAYMDCLVFFGFLGTAIVFFYPIYVFFRFCFADKRNRYVFLGILICIVFLVTSYSQDQFFWKPAYLLGALFYSCFSLFITSTKNASGFFANDKWSFWPHLKKTNEEQQKGE